MKQVDQALQWMSRTIAIVLFMIAPGMLGARLDRWLGTRWLTPAGFVAGTFLATILLVILARKLTPPAGGQPLPLDEPEDSDAHDDPAR